MSIKHFGIGLAVGLVARLLLSRYLPPSALAWLDTLVDLVIIGFIYLCIRWSCSCDRVQPTETSAGSLARD